MCSDPQCGQTKTTLCSCYVTNLAAACTATCPRWSPVTPSQQSPAQAIQKPTAQPAQLLYSLLITFYVTTPYALAMHVLPLISFLTLHCLALQQHQAASLAIISVFIWHFGQSLFICPNSPHAKHLILLASCCYNCRYGYGSLLHTGIPEHSKHNISQVHWHIARATCTT